jgi:uncharacterized protein YjdB
VPLVACLVVAACTGTAATSDAPAAPRSVPVLSRIALSVSPDTIQIGQTATARADYYDQYGAAISPGPVTWSAAPAGIVALGIDGTVTGLAPGLVVVSAASEGKTGFWNVTVLPMPVATVALTPKTVTLDIGLSRQLAVTLRDAAGHALGDDRTVYWSSSDTTRVSVSPDGRVTALAAGVASITATSEEVADSAVVTVSTRISPVARVALLPAAATIALGRTLQLSVWLTNAEGDTISGRSPTWSSSAPDVVRVSADGLVTAVAVGAATISASIEGQTATANVAVNDDVIVSVAQPDSLTVFEDTLPIVSSVKAKNTVAGVVATIIGAPAGFLNVPLVRTPEYNRVGAFVGYSWLGRLGIRDLATDSYRLLITAVDTQGTQGSAVAIFKHKHPGAGSGFGAGGKK